MTTTRRPTHALQDNTELNGYRILGVLGSGGFGITYHAVDLTDSTEVAIKEYFLKTCCKRGKDGTVQPSHEIHQDIFDWGFVRFHREAGQLSSLEHDNIVKVRQAFEANGTSYMVMNFVEGERLTRLIRFLREKDDGKVINESAALNMLNPLLDALEKIHARHIVHRDIKPDNIYIQADGHPILLDFGSAREIRPEVVKRVTRLVTDGYSPPEQYEVWSTEQGPWTDIYSLCVTTWEMITGKMPDPGDERMTTITDGGPDLMANVLAEFAHHYSGAFIEAVKTGLNVHAHQRPRSAGAFMEMLPEPQDPRQRLVEPERFDELLETFQSSRLLTHALTKAATLSDRAILRDHKATGKTFQNTLKDVSKGPIMVVIPTGFFDMGSPEEEEGRRNSEGPTRWVNIDKMIAVGKYPVTFAEYDKFAEAESSDLPQDRGWGRDNRPVINVSWHDAMAYTKWLSDQTGRHYRLLTEAEWEYVARADSKTPYWWGNEFIENRANCDGCGSRWDAEKTSPVGSFAPNSFGLCDTAGNVWEWVFDSWHDNYDRAPPDGSPWVTPGSKHRVIRGGSRISNPSDLRSARREGMRAQAPSINVGFRIARES